MAEPEKVDVVCVGLNAIDTLIPLATYPARGSKVDYSNASVMPGGQAATTGIACQTWALSTRYVGKLGEDDAARLHIEAFTGAGVDARIATVPGARSLHNIILVNGGERTVLCQRDERMVLKPEDLRREWITSARALHLDGRDTAAATLAATWAREAGIPVIADLDELYPGVEELVEKVDYLIVSRDFPCRLMDDSNLESALRRMQLRFGSRLTAATLGEDGVLAWDGERFHDRAAYRVHAVDTTGAGDIFHAGFIYGLLHGWPLDRQLDFACAAAAMNCMSAGARGGIKTVAAIEELMATTPRYLRASDHPVSS
jgi:sugar/nucleoside kinase (ribokinase family)